MVEIGKWLGADYQCMILTQGGFVNLCYCDRNLRQMAGYWPMNGWFVVMNGWPMASDIWVVMVNGCVPVVYHRLNMIDWIWMAVLHGWRVMLVIFLDEYL